MCVGVVGYHWPDSWVRWLEQPNSPGRASHGTEVVIKLAWEEPRFRDVHSVVPHRGGKMPQAHADPDLMDEFASQLRQFQEDCQERVSVLSGRFQTLCDTWQDQEQQKFQGVFDEFVSCFGRFIAGTEEYVPYLQRKASHLRDYLSS